MMPTLLVATETIPLAARRISYFRERSSRRPKLKSVRIYLKGKMVDSLRTTHLLTTPSDAHDQSLRPGLTGPRAFLPHRADSESAETRYFKTLSGMTQHVVSGRFLGGKFALWKPLDYLRLEVLQLEWPGTALSFTSFSIL